VSDGVLLGALDGSNPLAFLAALGTLRLLHMSKPDTTVRMRWERWDGFWRPNLAGVGTDEGSLCELLIGAPWAPVREFEVMGKNLTVSREKFREFVIGAHSAAAQQDRRTADFAAAFGCEVCEDKKTRDRIEYTKFCFITGSGHQDFLATISTLAERVTASHIREALFGQWRAEKGLSMRWDPSDAAEYALRWDDPSAKGASAVWGVNRLATEALPFFPTMPLKEGLLTTGFRFNKQGRRDEFTWPIWTHFAGFETVCSLVSLADLQKDEPERKELREMGIEEVYRSARVRIGQGANFKVSFRPARAV
jgi:hypothetical protein